VPILNPSKVVEQSRKESENFESPVVSVEKIKIPEVVIPPTDAYKIVENS